jgi:ABC-type sugar transport system permease subunit
VSAKRAGADAPLAWSLAAPALSIIALVTLFPIAWTAWESLHLDDLRMPWLGRRFVGVDNYAAALIDRRLWDAALHTASFVAISVTIELIAGLGIALALDRITRFTGILRTVVLLPWAVPTVVGALVWRFMFESPNGLAASVTTRLGGTPPVWLADPVAAWIPVILADAWKTTPFVALLLLAALQNIDRTWREAAALDGASEWQQFVHVTLPLLRPALLVALMFRSLDALRVFDVVYVLTGGGPGTSTEPIAFYAFTTLLRTLRFGYGSALSMLLFAAAFAATVIAIRVMDGSERPQEAR